jgi:hypothetical protein
MLVDVETPEGLPHIVVVSRNVFFFEMYEALKHWNKPHQSTRECQPQPSFLAGDLNLGS